MFKVIQWGVGYTGRWGLRYVLTNPSLELVGLKVFTEAKDGVDAGELIGRAPVGVRATRDTDALLATDADCVVFMPRDALMDPSFPTPPRAPGWRNCCPFCAAARMSSHRSRRPPTSRIWKTTTSSSPNSTLPARKAAARSCSRDSTRAS